MKPSILISRTRSKTWSHFPWRRCVVVDGKVRSRFASGYAGVRALERSLAFRGGRLLAEVMPHLPDMPPGSFSTSEDGMAVYALKERIRRALGWTRGQGRNRAMMYVHIS